MQDRLSIVEAQAEGGLVDGLSVERQRADLSALKAQLPPLLAREASSGNEIALLLGDHPGALHEPTGASRHATNPRRCPISRSDCRRNSHLDDPTSRRPRRGCGAPPPASGSPARRSTRAFVSAPDSGPSHIWAATS